MLAEGVGTPATIDRRPVGTAAASAWGPFELIDLIGPDVNLAVARSVYEGMATSPRDGGLARSRSGPGG